MTRKYGFKGKPVHAIVLIGTLLSLNVYGQMDTKHYIPPMFGRENLGDHFLFLSTTHPDNFDVTVKLGDGTLFSMVSLSDDGSVMIPLGSEINSPFMVKEMHLNAPIQTKGLIIEGDHPFSATIKVSAEEQSASLLSKGYKAGSGTDFRILHTFNNDGFNTDKTNVFSIMATADNTTINIDDIAAGVIFKDIPANTSNINITLNTGESVVYAVFVDNSAATNNTNGLNGAHISSDKPVLVNSGSWLGGNALIGTSSNGDFANGRDIGIDQMLPLKEMGTEYVLVKGPGIENERVIISPAYNNTSVQLNGSPLVTLNEGEYYALDVSLFGNNGNMYLSSSLPLFVAQTMNAGNGISDDIERQLDLNFIPPITCSGAREVVIPAVNHLGSPEFRVIVDAGHELYFNNNLVTGGVPVSGNPNYETYEISGNYAQDVTFTSTGLIRAHLLNLSNHQGAGSYYSGFTKDIKMSAEFIKEMDGDDPVIPEGCGALELTFTRGQELINGIDTIYITTAGLAQSGQDYTAIPNYVVLTAGMLDTTLMISVFQDNLQEVDENVIIQMDIPETPCGDEFIEFEIRDVDLMQVSIESDGINCPGDEVQLNGIVLGGVGPFEYEWSNGNSTDQIEIVANDTMQIFLQVNDFCDTEISDSIIVGIAGYELEIIMSDDMFIECPYTEIQLNAEATGGIGDIDYYWIAGSTLVGEAASITTQPAVSADYIVTATDECGATSQDTVLVDVTISLMELEMQRNI